MKNKTTRKEKIDIAAKDIYKLLRSKEELVLANRILRALGANRFSGPEIYDISEKINKRPPSNCFMGDVCA